MRIFDFETTGPEFFKKTGRAEVRYAALGPKILGEKDINYIKNKSKFKEFFSLRDFLEAVCKLENNSTLFAVNLSKFDGEFIVKFFKYNHDLLDTIKENDLKVDKNCNKFVSSPRQLKDYQVGDKCLSLIMDATKKIYELRIRSIYNKVIIFRCFLNLYGPTLSVKNCMKALKGNKEIEDIKSKEDYKVYDCDEKEFLLKCEDKNFLEERRRYMHFDIMSPTAYIINDHNLNKFSPFKIHRKLPLTAASHAFSLFKQRYNAENSGAYSSKFGGYKHCEIEHCKSRGCKHPKTKQIPHLDDEIYNDAMTFGYRGGFTFYNERWLERVMKGVHSIDIHSSYPAIYCKYPLPYGKPKVTKGKQIYTAKSNRLYMYFIEITKLRFKHDPYVFPPFFPSSRLQANGRYIIDYDADILSPKIKIGVGKEELDDFLEHYDITFKYVSTLEFECDMQIADVMKEIVDLKWDKSLTKAETDGIKLIINSFTGKFGENFEKVSPVMMIDHNGEIQEGSKITKFPKKYPYVVSRITFLGRQMLYKQEQRILKMGGIILYGDTDSVKFCNLPITPEVKKKLNIGDKLGQGGLEGENYDFKYLAPKSYIFNDGTGGKSKMKGYNKPISFESFKYGAKFYDKLQRQRVDSGVYLKLGTYTITKTANNITYPRDYKHRKVDNPEGFSFKSAYLNFET